MPDEVSRALGMDGGGFPVVIKNADGVDEQWTLSDCSKQIQSKHVAWLKAKLRQEKISQKTEGIISADECKEDLAALDQKFGLGFYSFGKDDWKTCLVTPDGVAKLYQLLLEQHHPETRDWTLEQIIGLVMADEATAEAFKAAMGDILPKVMRELEKAKVRPTPSSKSAPS